VGRRILEALNQPMTVQGETLQLGASVGVAMHPPLPGRLEVLMNRADQAMYCAKRAGKGRLFFAAPESG
jgi:predicted signal transduction protein with EAL and GGDEF domain